MRVSIKIILSLMVLLAFYLPLSGCGCGFGCSNDNDDDPTLLTLGLSDSLPEDLKKVVIKVDAITFRRSGAEDVVVDTFTIPEQNATDVDTFQINLLDYQGIRQLRVISDLELANGTYSEVLIKILANDINDSYVIQKADDKQVAITVSGGQLKLPGIRLSSGSQAFTVEFSLAQSLQLQAESGPYRLATTGIRIENNRIDASLSGQVDSALFNTVSPCDEKTDPEQGNRVYLYAGLDLAKDNLVDVFTNNSTETPPAESIAPFAVAALVENGLTGNWEYAFGYLPAGEYTMAFSCNTQNDDAVQWNELVIPLPENQVYKITLAEGDRAQCNLTDKAGC
jgi:hypothetical protein